MKYDIKKGALKRFLRTAIPQIPAVTVYLADIASELDLATWVVPTFVFLGAIATALDKYMREVMKARK